MGLNFVFTIDGDWDEYFYTKLSEERRRPALDRVLSLIRAEEEMAEAVGGKFVHFAHTSPLVRDFFLRPELIAAWKRLEASGAEVGVHCHEEELYTAWHYADPARMGPVIAGLARGLREAGLSPVAYRGGFMAFGPAVIPLLEANGLPLDYSCDPGRYLVKNEQVVSDWRGAPDNFYRLDYQDHRKPGSSRVCEVPLGVYIERQSLPQIWQACRRLARREGHTVVAVLAHTYDFASWRMRLKIRAALAICTLYGSFIGSREVLEKIKEAGI
jgi:hypothetical protein